jgi:septal ring factor EnvC (AmiA/AmiB activator)
MKKKEVKTKKMTIDKLAIMMNNGFERLEEKMATKEDLQNLERRMSAQESVTEIMLKEIVAIHADTKSFRENISTLYTDHIGYDRKISDLGTRVEKLELKK